MEHTDDQILERWMAGARSSEAARRRRRSAAWQVHGAEDATLAGVLRDLADLRCEVVITLGDGRQHRGAITAVGSAASNSIWPG